MFLIIFLFLFALICANKIRHGIYAIIFLMPLYLWRFSFLGIPTTALEIMIYILFLVWIINFFKSKEKSKLKLKGTLLNVGIILLFLGLIISTSFSSDLRTSLGIVKGWFFDPFLFFIVFINIIKKEKYIILSLSSWLASGVVVSLFSFLFLLKGNFTFDGRLRAFFLSPNYLAMYLAPTFLIAIWFLLEDKISLIPSSKFVFFKKIFNHYSLFQNGKNEHFIIQNYYKLLVLIIILIPLFFTYSYGAFLGIFAGILYLINYILRDKKNLAFVSLLIIIFISFAFVSFNKYNQIINSENRSSFHSRIMIWNVAGRMIKDNPLFGIGPGTFQKTYLSYAGKFSEPYLEWAVPQPHNIFLAFYLQTGLIGFVGFILILVWFFRLVLKSKDNNIPYRISSILVSLMIYTLVYGLVDTTYWKNDLSLMFWLLIGFKIANSIDFYKVNSRE